MAMTRRVPISHVRLLLNSPRKSAAVTPSFSFRAPYLSDISPVLSFSSSSSYNKASVKKSVNWKRSPLGLLSHCPLLRATQRPTLSTIMGLQTEILPAKGNREASSYAADNKALELHETELSNTNDSFRESQSCAKTSGLAPLEIAQNGDDFSSSVFGSPSNVHNTVTDVNPAPSKSPELKLEEINNSKNISQTAPSLVNERVDHPLTTVGLDPVSKSGTAVEGAGYQPPLLSLNSSQKEESSSQSGISKFFTSTWSELKKLRTASRDIR